MLYQNMLKQQAKHNGIKAFVKSHLNYFDFFGKKIKCEFHKGFGPSVQGKDSRKRINHALGAIYI